MVLGFFVCLFLCCAIFSSLVTFLSHFPLSSFSFSILSNLHKVVLFEACSHVKEEQQEDPPIKLFGSDIQIHTTDSHTLSQIHSLPQQQSIMVMLFIFLFIFFAPFYIFFGLHFFFSYIKF